MIIILEDILKNDQYELAKLTNNALNIKETYGVEVGEEEEGKDEEDGDEERIGDEDREIRRFLLSNFITTVEDTLLDIINVITINIGSQ